MPTETLQGSAIAGRPRLKEDRNAQCGGGVHHKKLKLERGSGVLLRYKSPGELAPANYSNGL